MNSFPNRIYWLVSYSVSNIPRFQEDMSALVPDKIPQGLQGHGKPRHEVNFKPSNPNHKLFHSVWSTSEGKTEQDLQVFLESFCDPNAATLQIIKYDIGLGKNYTGNF